MLARRMERVTASRIMELIKTTAGGEYISFASGLPDPALYPVETLREITDYVLSTDGRAALQYGPAEGYGPLRELVAGILRGRGFADATAEHILITNGSQQSLDLVARALLDDGDRVAVESPSYLAAIQTFDSYQAQYQTLAMDEGGMVAEGLGPSLRSVKLLYTLPNFQNPTGLTLAAERRQQVAEATAAAGAALLEDDAYHDLRYDGAELPPVAALAANPWAVYTGTFSKTVAPGIRVGYLYAQPGFVQRLAQLKQITDLHTGSLTQRVAYEYCRRGCLEPGVRHFVETYRSRRDVMLAELEQRVSGVVRWTRPGGGMFIWVTLPDGADADQLLEKAMARGVVFVPGRTFHPDGRGANTLRLNFVSADEARIREGIGILAEVIWESFA